MGEIERLDPPRQLGNVTLLAVLGEGGMATVYLASIGTGAGARLVAVKLLRPGLPDHDYRTRFKDEAKLVLRLHHPNIVEVREAGDLHEQLFIVMALVEGRDLADIWDRCAAVGKAFPVPLAVHIIREVLRGLHYAHTFPGLGLVHRDVSPSNLLIDWTGVVRLADFGLATSTLKGSLTVPGVVFGKVGYMSPEQARHETLDGRADVYACGAVLWELLTGRPLRGGDGVDTEDVSNFNAPPASSYSSRVDAELDGIVAKALARDREDRYLSAHDFMEALGVWLAKRGIVGTAGTEQMAEFLAMLFGDAATREREARDALLGDLSHATATAAPHRSAEANKDTLGDAFAEDEEFDLSLSEDEDEDSDRANMKIIPLPERPDRLERSAADKAPNSQVRRPRPKDEFGFPENPQNDVEHIEAGTIIADRYRVVSRIGRGGMGTVYLGEHTTVGRRVAIKVLTHQWSRSELVAKRFRAEARAASAAGHPNIIEVFDAGQLPDGRLYLVMEYLTGRNLYEEMEELGTLPVGRACRIIRAVARAIRAAHDVGIIHRDLKPDNVMFVPLPEGEGETVKVLDFGISAGAERTEAEARLTVPGHALGTPEYMAPEQAKGKDATELFDVYALGVMLYECLVGEPPFVSNNLVEIMARKSTEKAPSLGQRRPDLPKALVTLVDACLEVNPADRPQSAREFLQKLEEVIRILPADGEPGDINSDASMVGVPVPGPRGNSGPSRKPSGPKTGPVPLPHPVRPVTVPYTDQKRLLGIAGIGVAAVVLLYVAFSGGPDEDPGKLASNTTQAQTSDSNPDPTPPVKVDPGKKVVPADPTKVDPTKVDPTKVDPTKVDPTKVDPTKTGDTGDVADPGKEPKKGDPKPKLDPASEQCKKIREKVSTARNALNFHDMLRFLNDKGCWQSKGEHGKLKTLAYKELGKFRECAAAGKGNSDPEVVKWVNLCTKRADSG